MGISAEDASTIVFSLLLGFCGRADRPLRSAKGEQTRAWDGTAGSLRASLAFCGLMNFSRGGRGDERVVVTARRAQRAVDYEIVTLDR